MKKYGEIENFGEEIAKMFSDLEIKIMEKMVDLIKENGFSGASSDYLMNRLRSLGVAEEDVAKYFEEALKGTEIKLDKIFDDEVYKEYYGHYRDFQAVGFDQIPYKDNIELQQLVSGIHDQTFEKIGGMSASLGFVLRQPNGQLIATPLQTFYQSQLDQAILEISSGAFSYEQVLERVINKMTSSGVRIINFESGAHRGMVSHVRTAILTGFRQIQGRINEQTAQELGTEYFEISYHVGARPTHQIWQGRVFSKEELVTKCGLGSVTGLCGANCYHTYRPFIPGVSVRTYSDDELKEMIAEENKKKLYNGKEYTTYEALQQQRYLERMARKYRQDIRLLERGLEDADDAAKEILILKQARYQNTLSRYKDFTKKMGLPTQNERIFNDGLGKIKVSRKKIKKETETFTAKDGSLRVKKVQKEKAQAYRRLDKGDKEEFVIKRTKGVSNISTRKLDSYSKPVYLSDKAKVTRRDVHVMYKNTLEAYKKYQFSNLELPKIVILDQEELAGSFGVYDCVTNTVYYSSDIANRKGMESHGGIGITEYHEMWHAKQADNFKGKGWVFTEENRKNYIELLRKECKSRIDKLGITADNVGEISRYASTSYVAGHWDEVEAEYHAVYRKR